MGSVSTAKTPDDHSALKVYPPEEGMRRARPLPPLHEMVIDATPEEWSAFQAALVDT
jgi:hypothetical protein